MKCRRPAAVDQLVWFACGLKITEFVFVLPVGLTEVLVEERLLDYCQIIV
jgi:hypothetical protein